MHGLFSESTELLKELFEILLAHPLEETYENEIHPAFLDIIKQLSSLDAQLIKNARYLEDFQPIIRIFICGETKDDDLAMAEMPGFCTSDLKVPVFSHYSLPIQNINQDAIERNISIFNLHRLGLVNTDYFEKIIEPEAYKPLYDEVVRSEVYKKASVEAEAKGFHVGLTRGYTSPTAFGRRFYKVLLSS